MFEKFTYMICLVLFLGIVSNSPVLGEFDCQFDYPNPDDGETGLPLDVALSWETDGEFGDFDWQELYFSTDYWDVVDAVYYDSPAYIDTIYGENCYDIDGLEYDTTYYWKIIGFWDYGDIIFPCVGPVWEFTTMSEPDVPDSNDIVVSRPTAGIIDVKINLYGGLKDDPNNAGKDPNAVDPNGVIKAVNKNFQDNGFNYQLVVKQVNTIDANDGEPNIPYGGDSGHGTAGDGVIVDEFHRRYTGDPNDPNEFEKDSNYRNDPNYSSEFWRAVRYGRSEALKPGFRRDVNDPNVYKDPNNWEAVKISICRELEDHTTLSWDPNYLDVDKYPGVSIHRNPVVFATTRGVRRVIIEHAQGDPNAYCYRAGDPNDPNTFNERMAETVKHEIGHMLTLVGGHQIGLDPNDPNDLADDSGHAKEIRDPNHHNDPNHNGNFMAPSNWRHNSKITKPQIDEMSKMARIISRIVRQNEPNMPAEKVKQQAGSASDKTGDMAGEVVTDISFTNASAFTGSLYDIGLVYLYALDYTDKSPDDKDNIEAIIMVNAALPENEYVAVEFTLGFDIDADTTTGIVHTRQEGTDRIVTVVAIGNISDGTFDLFGQVYDTQSQEFWILPESPTYEIEDRFVDANLPVMPVATSFLFRIPKDMLDLSASEVPVIATSGWAGSISDTAEFFFDRQRWLKYPSLELFGNGTATPGQEYPFSVSGLAPNGSYMLRLNDEIVYTGTLDNTGSDSSAFVFPGNVPVSKINFLVAQDGTGEYAFNITSPKPDN